MAKGLLVCQRHFFGARSDGAIAWSASATFEKIERSIAELYAGGRLLYTMNLFPPKASGRPARVWHESTLPFVAKMKGDPDR